MSASVRHGQRHLSVIELRNAALRLLGRAGKRDESGDLWFQRHSPTNPEPPLVVLLAKMGKYSSLNVWATMRGQHLKVLNVTLIGDAVSIISFRRGDWEDELRAMGREPGIALH